MSQHEFQTLRTEEQVLSYLTTKAGLDELTFWISHPLRSNSIHIHLKKSKSPNHEDSTNSISEIENLDNDQETETETIETIETIENLENSDINENSENTNSEFSEIAHKSSNNLNQIKEELDYSNLESNYNLHENETDATSEAVSISEEETSTQSISTIESSSVKNVDQVNSNTELNGKDFDLEDDIWQCDYEVFDASQITKKKKTKPLQFKNLNFTKKGNVTVSSLKEFISKFVKHKYDITLSSDKIDSILKVILEKRAFETVDESASKSPISSPKALLRHSRRHKFGIRVVVVGGGFGGRKFIRTLESKLQKFPSKVEIILVSARKCFESLPSIPTLLRNYENLSKIRAEFDKYFKYTTIIHQKLSKIINDTTIELSNGQIIDSIDYLVLATGSEYDMTRIEVDKDATIVNCTNASDVISNYKKIHDAKSIAIIGGGPVGVEMAGELLIKYPEKNIHIISSRNQLLERCCKAAHKNTKKFFDSFKHSNIVLGNSVKKITKTQVLTDGPTIDADIVLCCLGFFPNTKFIQNSWQESESLENVEKPINQYGQIIVNEYLQVQGHPSIFAIGDITSIIEEKLAQVAESHASLVAGNILNSELGQSILPYTPKTRPILVSFGPKHSMLIRGDIVVFEGLIISLVKQLVDIKLMW